MLTTPGIGETSALQILGELAVLPDTLDARQWVAFSGLDPRRFKSGTSVEKKPRISRGGSRHLRRALCMPALVAIRFEPYLQGFYQRLLGRGKTPLQAVVAVMRKLLHAFFAMFQFHQPYDGSKLCPVISAPRYGRFVCCLTRKKERGFSVPLRERKKLTIKRESNYSRSRERHTNRGLESWVQSRNGKFRTMENPGPRFGASWGRSGSAVAPKHIHSAEASPTTRRAGVLR
jgi:Transposase IS116/IS110/IS902 family